MIPWRLNIAGIRDFRPTSIDLSGEGEHVGIFGPNGVGKSTLSFCMGAVLYSSKVNLSGLRSANLEDDQVWKASISFLFKNAGEIKVDAPAYVQFELHMEQAAQQIIAREYQIKEGDEPDRWDTVTTYKSGDRANNFPAYKRLLQQKYHIDPDYYYLIWYQNEVNQFSEMAPEERFRIFSEMHGIDKIQKNWEESKELVREAEEALEEAKLQQSQRKMKLSIQKTKLDRFLDHQKRLKEGFVQYYHALSVLIQLGQEEMERLTDQQERIGERHDEAMEQMASIEGSKEKLRSQLEGLDQKRTLLQEELYNIQKDLGIAKKEYTEVKTAFQELEQELEAVRKEVSQIPNEETVDHVLKEQEEETERLRPDIMKQEELMETNESAIQEAKEEKMKLEYEDSKDNDKEKHVNQLLSLYQSSYHVDAQIKQLDQSISDEKDLLKELKSQLSDREAEQKELLQNEVYSPRQKEAKDYFKKKGMRAFALRELIKLDQRANLADEEAYNSMKYTMFVDGRDFNPPNDLYYVPLPSVIPEGYRRRLPEQRLAVRDDLPEEIEPFAIKALWWVRSFFIDHQLVRLQNKYIVDEKGVRGPQEHNRYILSEQALNNRLEELEEIIGNLRKQKEAVEQSLEMNENRVRSLRNITSDVKEAEAFRAEEKHRILRRKRLKELGQQIIEKVESKQSLNEELKELAAKLSAAKAKIELYQSYKQVWLKFASVKEKVKQLEELQTKMDSLSQLIKEQKRIEDARTSEYDATNDSYHSVEKQVKRINSDLEDLLRIIEGFKKEQENLKKEQETEQNSYFQYNEELLALEKTAPNKVKEEQMKEWEKWSKPEAIHNREIGKTTFINALHEKDIDPYAPENYEKMKEEYDLTSKEVKESEILLSRHSERMEHLRDDLDTSIQGKVLLINKHFVTYMDQFGFDGELEWDLHEGKRGTMHYYLYLRAKKFGHKMAMEDVSVKARGGKHGVGLSGGEKSLVSLLYALALLQTIQTNPSFIVLDEFDSALDEGRKVKVFDLYVQELGRKMIVLTPKSHDTDYMNRFSKAIIIYHRPEIPESGIMKLKRK
ncbi:AAA family ATPase [Bacillus testis]|uniref:AAA family ATPase n=1 Tax=Bacillus testis TaxID=1622072 RepID=UPI00067F6FA3|nr:AAA family ATPase [Bacillus testis]